MPLYDFKVNIICHYRVIPTSIHPKCSEWLHCMHELTSDRKVSALLGAPACSRYSYTYSANLKQKHKAEHLFKRWNSQGENVYLHFWQPLSSDEKRKQSDVNSKFSSFEKRNWWNQIIKYFLISLSYYNIQHKLHYMSRNSKLFDLVFWNHSKSTTVDWRNSHWYRSSQKVELKNHRFEAILFQINFELVT